MLRRGVLFLVNQACAGCPEAIHYLDLPRLTQSSWEVICCPSDMFPRTLVLDSLLDAIDYDPKITKELVEKEIQYIINSKHQTVSGVVIGIPAA